MVRVALFSWLFRRKGLGRGLFVGWEEDGVGM
jgi:hypothetical protein